MRIVNARFSMPFFCLVLGSWAHGTGRGSRRGVAGALLVAQMALLAVLPAGAEANSSGAAFAGVAAQVKKIPLKIRNQELQEALREAGGDSSYEISFGRIKEPQFAALKKYFRKQEPLDFDAQKNYELLDFLPAKMQALMNKRLEDGIRHPKDLAAVDLFFRNHDQADGATVMSTINCWGTAWEMTRDSSVKTPFVAFMGSRRFAQKMMTDPKLSDAVKAEQAQFGDLILFFADPNQERLLQHVAVYLGHGYYFERTDSGPAMFFRIAHLEDMKGRLRQAFAALSEEGQPEVKVRFELRRFLRQNQSTLSSPYQIFSLANSREPGIGEYQEALPRSENPQKLTLFADDRMGSGDANELIDMVEFRVRLSPVTGRGEIDPREPGASRLKSSD